jgi:hypothetical protein
MIGAGAHPAPRLNLRVSDSEVPTVRFAPNNRRIHRRAGKSHHNYRLMRCSKATALGPENIAARVAADLLAFADVQEAQLLATMGMPSGMP